MVRNAHSFIFYSHVRDLFMMHNSRAHSWGDSLSCVKFGGKDDQSLGLLPLQTYTSITLGDGIELVRPNNRWFEKMLQELFGDDRDIMQFFNSWNDKKVKINGMAFKIMEKDIAKVRGFSLRGKNWCEQERVNYETSLWKFVKFDKELV